LRRVLKRARAAAVSPTAILSSPYRRAMETAEVAVEVLGFGGKVERTGALVPEASPFDTWEEIRAHKNEESILLASHEPLMSSLAAFLLNSPALHVDMKKAALVRIDIERIAPNPQGILKWMLTPAVAE
jgi:phosphohistidine phosphatase